MTAHLSVVGRKNSGKTTLMKSLIAELVRRGLSVATVKHTSHAHEFDTPGKDSWVHRQAGSAVAVILSPERWSCHAERPDREQLDELHRTLFHGKDIVLWEGRGNPEAPKVECVPPGLEAMHHGDPGLLAVVGESSVGGAAERFSPGQTAALADWVVRRFKLGADRPEPPGPPAVCSNTD